MKKIYLLIILLVSGFGFAQATVPEIGSYEVVFNGWAYGDEHHNCGAASVTLEFSTPADNYKALDITYSDNRATDTYTNKNSFFKANKTPVSMFFTATRYDRQSCRGNRPHNSGRITTTDKFRCFDYNFAFNQFTNVESDGAGLSSSSFNVKVRPVLVIASPGANDELPTDRRITIASNTGFFPSEYNWQYSFNRLDPNSWVDLPQFSTKSSFTANAVEIIGANAGEYHGKRIYFRQKACTTTSVPVSYIVRQSAPEIISKTEEKTRCFDSKDGKLILKFNRPLFNGEQMTFSIKEFDEAQGVWKEATCSSQGPDDEIVLDGTNSFEFPCNFAKGKYGITFLGFINGSNTGSPHTDSNPYIFNITSPTPVDFSITKKNDINCFGGSDGAIDVVATGGIDNGIYQYSSNGGNWITFLNGDKTTISGLGLGTYAVKVRKLKNSTDTVGCIAKKSDDTEKVLPETIGQPASALQLVKITPFNPTFNKAENGKIVALVTGGTLINGNSYSYQWKNSKNDVIDASKTSTQFLNNIVTISLNNVPEDTYTLFVKDERNCTLDPVAIPSLVVILDDPEPIEITLETIQGISCNTANLDPVKNRDKSSDAIIKATVKGGIQFVAPANNGLPYKFTWSKYNTVTKLWDKLEDYKTATANELSEGDYSLNVEDANGIVQGTYNTTDLVTAIPAIEKIAEPAQLVLAFTSGDVSCYEGNNGWAIASVTKGKAPYKYTWYGVDGGTIDENKIAKLIKGEYFVEVTDDNGCFVKGSIVIDGPTAPVAISYKEIFTPTFSGATNGRIIAEITGGTPFDPALNNGKLYNYEWKNTAGTVQTATAAVENGIYTITLNGVPAEDYFLTITDKNYDEATSQIVNCSILESKVTLNEPDPLKVVFEVVRDISCNTSNEFGNSKDTTPNDGQRDESQDGILKANVSGGTPLAADKNNGLPYYFYWKKQQQDGTWIALADIKGETASNLSHGNYALNVEDRNGIRLGTYVNNVLTQEIDVTKFMQEPPKLSVTITKGNVFCNGGNDGWATATVTGGTFPYEYKWSNGVEIDKNTVLKAGTYTVYVTDFKKCTTQATVIISEPAAPLAVKYIEILDPSFYKATNGKIVAEVTGGTILPDNTYWFEWKNSKGIVQTTTTASFNNGVYTISLNGVGEELYSLTVRDANYNASTNKTSCTVANSVTALDDPDPLEVTFEVVRTISCNASNEFGNETDANPHDNQRDESQDGILVAHVKGGIQLAANKNNGLPYYYTWKKQVGNSWIIWNDHDETAENISNGIYALNIEDANGIKLGTYVNNILVKENDAIKDMPEPAKLQLTFTKFDVGCTTGDDGWAEAHVSGGTPPYTYEWTNGATTPKIENITTNNYFVKATDAKGCIIQGSIFVGDPNGILTTETVKNPTCYKGNDASIVLNVTGGNLPYSYLWNTGATTKDLNNLTAGNYEVAITCPDCCVYKKKFVLKDPEAVMVNIGPDRTLCIDQNMDLNAAIADPKAQYSWTSTNGFTSNEAKINVSKAGTYHVKVTSGLGCIGEDEIVIKTSQTAISSEFLLSSQAYLDEEVILINTSNPFGESTNWVIPKGVKVVEQKEKYITLKFDATGVYSIGLEQTQGECYAVYSKNITVEQRSGLPNAGTTAQFIVDFIVTPNPSNGNFKAHITLENDSSVNLRLFSTTGQNTMIQKSGSGKKKYAIDFETTLESGMYVLVLETGQQTLVKKIIIY
ncbi:T9SS type A sorting domain-containing protein [Flavobacterium aquidurense]|uniref:Por secretion system C-terminal sorting domain containing protein n=1 Tax=Flavobacterium aquidurense TaxID=362413 RepID=A0A0N8VMV8_9FLAO|nr:T9SS type A sorting domain-containing protein [Flavobacterium aquidurense]KQB40404.1 Por secretion system C-terminal sorting domain containing protein [Flavobacterium aquidurense]